MTTLESDFEFIRILHHSNIPTVLYRYKKRSNQPRVNNRQRKENQRRVEKKPGQTTTIKSVSRQRSRRHTKHTGDQ
jgi:hypothetical protein